MTRYYLQTKKTSLSYGISDTETAMRLTGLYKLDGTSVSAADIGDYMTGTFDPGTSKEEIFSIASSGVTVNADGTVDITGVVRGLREGGTAGYSTGGYSAEHGAGAVVVISNNPQLYAQMANKSNPNTFTDLNIFQGYAPQTDTDPVNPNDMTRLSYVQALVLGTLTTIDVVVPGIAGETIADGNLIYLNTDNKWYKTDADTASTVNNVLLGIAKGAGTLNNQITNGILLQGVDNAQSGLVAGEIQYASNTAGAISNTPGTTEVTVGVAKSTTELYFAPRFNQMLTEDQQDALTGTSGTPSATNKYVTDEDSRLDPQNIVFGDGSDGNVTISGATSLTRDMYYDTLTVNTGVHLDTAGFRVFAKTGVILTGTATLGRIGNNGSNGTAGTNGSGGGGGGAGSTGGIVVVCTPSISGTGTIKAVGGNGGNGGSGGNGNTTTSAAGGAGGNGGAALADGSIKGGIAGTNGSAGGSSSVNSIGSNGTVGATPSTITNSIGSSSTTSISIQAGNGGTSGSHAGGTGAVGGASGVATQSSLKPRTAISAIRQIDEYVGVTAGTFFTGSNTAPGAGGGGGAAINNTVAGGGGGGGAGGNGGTDGVIVLVYRTLSGVSTSVVGGSGGSGGSKGLKTGGAAADGTDGTAGISGASGQVYSIIV